MSGFELEGMWVHVSEPEHWRVGQIVKDLGNGFYLTRMEHANPEFPLNHYYEALSLAKYAMLASQCDWAGLTFFESKEQLNIYTKWMTSLGKKNEVPQPEQDVEQDNTKSNVINIFDKRNEPDE
jgi:hypothetical protein